jgi:hypothetical protein
MESFPGQVESRASTLSQVQATLEKDGIEFVNKENVGVQLAPKPSPKRARSR